MSKVITNELPYIFPSWNNLRNYLSENNLLNQDLIELTFDISKDGQTTHELTVYRFSLFYIKAMCFDEFCSLEITKADVLNLQRVFEKAGIVSGGEVRAQEKFRSMINLFDSRHL